MSIMDKPTDQKFHQKYVKQVEEAKISVFNEICREVGVNDYKKISSRHLLAKKNVTKKKLCEWLGTVCCILDQYSLPWLQKAVTLANEIQSLQSEKISDQKTISDLQGKLVKKQKDQPRSVQTIGNEIDIKNYSPLLMGEEKSNEKTIIRAQKKLTTTQKNQPQSVETTESPIEKICPVAESENLLAPKKVKAVSEKEGYKTVVSKNRFPAPHNDQIHTRFDEILVRMEERPLMKNNCRVEATAEKSSNLPANDVTVSKTDHVQSGADQTKVLKSERKLPDGKVTERKVYKKLLYDLRKKRVSEPERVHYIRNNKVVSSIWNFQACTTNS